MQKLETSARIGVVGTLQSARDFAMDFIGNEPDSEKLAEQAWDVIRKINRVLSQIQISPEQQEQQQEQEQSQSRNRPAEFTITREHQPGLADDNPATINTCWCGWRIQGADVQLETRMLRHEIDHLAGRAGSNENSKI